jgi:hypothetical protein
MVRSCFGSQRRNQPAHVQGIPEKAADGIRTHDLLHGKRLGRGHAETRFSASQSRFLRLTRTATGFGLPWITGDSAGFGYKDRILCPKCKTGGNPRRDSLGPFRRPGIRALTVGRSHKGCVSGVGVPPPAWLVASIHRPASKSPRTYGGLPLGRLLRVTRLRPDRRPPLGRRSASRPCRPPKQHRQPRAPRQPARREC